MATDTPATASDTYKNQIRDIGPFIDARQYGIVSDPVKDQTTEFQAMADDFDGSSHIVMLPEGEFHITDSILFNKGLAVGFFPTAESGNDGISGPQIVGQGRYGTKIYMDTAGKPAFIVQSATGSTQVLGTRFDGFSLHGPGIDDENSCGLQLGGQTIGSSDIVVRSKMSNLLITNFSSAMRLDDCSNMYLDNLKFDGYNYGIEFGYNIDMVLALECAFGSQNIPVAVACTTSSGSAVVTGIFSTNSIVVGMQIVSDAFPQGTKVISVDDANTITADNTATLTGAQSIDFNLGLALSYGAGPWTPSFNGTGSSQVQDFNNCWFMRQAACINVADNDVANIKFDTCYFERCNKIGVLGDPSSTSGIKYVGWHNCHFSQNVDFQSFAIEDVSAGNGESFFHVLHCRSDSDSPVPWVKMRSGHGKLKWANNNLPVASGVDRIVISATNFFTPGEYKSWSINLGDSITYYKDLGVAGVFPLTPLPDTSHYFTIGPMTGNCTVSDVITGWLNWMVSSNGRQTYKFVITEDATAGHTVTWGSQFKFHTSFTDSVVTTDANKTTVVEFTYVDYGVFIQTSPANVWL